MSCYYDVQYHSDIALNEYDTTIVIYNYINAQYTVYCYMMKYLNFCDPHIHFRFHTFTFTFSHSLLDAKINSVLSLCHDQVILNAVHSIIQNMIACEEASQQQLSYLQSES